MQAKLQLKMTKRTQPIGIDDMAIHVPALYLDIRDLAEARNIQYEKLAHGLGLLKMAFPDAHEDAATMAAEAIYELMAKNNLRPSDIGRVYMGTESALDGAKPTATYAVEMVQQRIGGSFNRCDVVDLTFACIGAVDALQNCLDWVAGDRSRQAIVVASDFAKYEAGSTGEYTQGAGAVAMLVKWHPRLLVVPSRFGVAMDSVHDFYKPRRERFTETPVFDGPFSNQCYQDRMSEALGHFRELLVESGTNCPTALSDRWERMVFHLPYSFHAKRVFVEEFVKERKAAGNWEAILAKNNFEEPHPATLQALPAQDRKWQEFLKNVAKTPEYQHFVKLKIEKSQRTSSEVGNLYTGSVFLALMGTLEADFQENVRLTGKKLGFVAYGSGSKSKVFEATVQPGWQDVVAQFQLSVKLSSRRAISYETYMMLHDGSLTHSVLPQEGRFALHSVGQSGNLLGSRHYGMFHLNGRAVVQLPAMKKAELVG